MKRLVVLVVFVLLTGCGVHDSQIDTVNSGPAMDATTQYRYGQTVACWNRLWIDTPAGISKDAQLDACARMASDGR